jgi:hypothetical protein
MTQMQPSSESNYEIELRTDYVYMKIVGVYNSQQFMGLPEIILNECGKVKSEKILVDMLNVDFSNLSTMERYFLGEEFAKVISYHASVAAVVPEKVITKFLETVATNRGANIVVVSDFSIAEAWLKNQ